MTFAQGIFWGAVFIVVVAGLPVPFVAPEIGWKAAFGIWLLVIVACSVVGGAIGLLAWGLSS